VPVQLDPAIPVLLSPHAARTSPTPPRLDIELTYPPRRVQLRVGVVSTYPPKLCGLATFAAALCHALSEADAIVDPVALVDDLTELRTLPVKAVLLSNSPGSLRTAVASLGQSDVVMLQHEFGIFGGRDGDEVLEIIDRLAARRIPVITTLHTVPASPTPHQRVVLEAVVQRSAAVVVMSYAGRRRLTAVYGVAPDVPIVIPHGARLGSWSGICTDPAGGPFNLLTWGLLGPGKGIEHVIDAVALLTQRGIPVSYTVAGATHPNVLLRDGDAYRDSLKRRSVERKVEDRIRFDATYRTVTELVEVASRASAVVLPYDSGDQVTSGVLVDAIAAGRPVIATSFPHAVELLASGAGIVVPHADPPALASAIESAAQPSILADLTTEARRIAPTLSWSAVAGRYLDLAARLPRSARRH
jgi:polysaccharide biosynthesis protein PslF